MKTLHAVALLALSLLAAPAAAQNTDEYQKDSTDIAAEREVLISSLHKLRDSITQSIGTLDQRVNSAAPKSKTTVRSAMRELSLYRERVLRDLQELETTSEKGWDANVARRIQTSADEVRREYRRIRQDVKPYLSTRS